MKYLVTGEEMKLLDTNTSVLFHVPAVVLMEQAAGNFVRELFLCQKNIRKILVICGTGNNGADGIAIARLMNQSGYHAEIGLMGDHGTELFDLQKSIYDAYAYPYYKEPIISRAFAEKAAASECISGKNDYDVIIDAVFGIGLSRPVTGVYAQVISWMNDLSGTKYAVDIASGIHATTGQVQGLAFKADYTITFSFGKLGHFLWPGSDYAGKVIVSQMGITIESADTMVPGMMHMEPEDLPKFLPKRKAHSNKGSYGKLLIIAGSKNMSGAALFAAKAAYRCGSGLVRILTHESNRLILQTSIPEAVLVTYSEHDCPTPEFLHKLVTDQIKWADAIVAGPGLGISECASDLLRSLLTAERDIPVILDADALNLIAASEELKVLLQRRRLPIIITPHLGEMSRLTGKSIPQLQEDLVGSARVFAKENHVITVLKDFHTITSLPSGYSYMNLTGNNGMATAGSGDVLAGIIGSMLGQGVSPEKAAPLGVMLHGMAGDEMVENTGYAGMMATDIIEGLGRIWQKLDRNA